MTNVLLERINYIQLHVHITTHIWALKTWTFFFQAVSDLGLYGKNVFPLTSDLGVFNAWKLEY